MTSRDYSNINYHSNDYLRTVTFEEPSNIRYIGDYAFMSCNALESVVIPNTVEDLGQGIFECDKKLSEVLFQTVTDPDDTKYGQVKFTKIRNWTFWYCTGLKSLELPDGITEIEGETTGAALQYMTSLINIRLPNTLKTIGPHFLCCAQSLRTLIIPASVTNIKAACFHGCESLEAVYLLGPAASMEAGSNSATNFNGNNVLCLDGVSDCTFFTTDDYISSYRNNSEWGKVAEGSSYYKGHGNKLTTIEPETRTFAGNKWVTAIFPNGVENFRNEVADGGFGPQARVALLDHVNVDDENSNVYHMTFVLIDGNDIPAATPVLICPSEDAVHTMYTNADAASSEFKSEMSKEHAVQVTAENGAVISMKGKYVDYRLMPWDFYYSGGKFYRISTAENAVDIKQCRAYWTLDINGVKAPIGAVEAAMRNQTTGIDEPLNKAAYYVVDGIYDLNGRKLDVAAEELPHGVFIVNGKKIMIK